MSEKPLPAAMVAAEEAEKTAEHRRTSNEERERNLQSARDADLRKQAAEVRVPYHKCEHSFLLHDLSLKPVNLVGRVTPIGCRRSVCD